MTPKESAVLNYINMSRIARTEQLSEKLGMSESTVRRILDKLERQHKIVRFHGGASANTEERMQTQLSVRFDKQSKNKDLIAKKAAEQVKSDSTIILLGGTTVSYMCPYLRNKRLTIITNSMLVLDALKFEKGIRIVLLGGVYDNEESEVKGALTSSALQQLGADTLFSGATGFDVERGFLTSHISAIELYRHCFQSSGRVYMLVDSSKYQQRDLAAIARSEDVDCLICDSGLPDEAAQRFAEHGVEVLVADGN